MHEYHRPRVLEIIVVLEIARVLDVGEVSAGYRTARKLSHK